MTEILVPRITANEEVMSLVYVTDSQTCKKGDVVCVFESTKATFEFAAEESGHVLFLKAKGDQVSVGEVVGYISAQKIDPVEACRTAEEKRMFTITRKAQVLLDRLEIDPSNLGLTGVIKEADVAAFARKQGLAQLSKTPLRSAAANSILLFGGGTHGHTIIDLIRQAGEYEVYGIVDDGLDAATSVMGIEVIGGSHDLERIREAGVETAANCLGGVKNLFLRKDVSAMLEENGFDLPRLVHPRAIVEPSANVAANVHVLAGSYVGSQVVIATGVIVGTLAIVSHDTTIGEATHVSPGAMIAGYAEVGSLVQIGMGVTINAGATIGDRAQIGNGANVHSDIPPGTIVRTPPTWREQ